MAAPCRGARTWLGPSHQSFELQLNANPPRGFRRNFSRRYIRRSWRPEGGAGAGIAAAEDGSGVVADGEQARDRLPPDVQDARPLVGDQAVIGGNVTRNDLHGIEWRDGYLADARVRRKILVAEKTLIGVAPRLKARSWPSAGVLIDFFDRPLEIFGGDAGGRRSSRIERPVLR